jgi:hypothetical protein
VAETRPVETDDPVRAGQATDDAADYEVPDHDAVAMDEHDGPPRLEFMSFGRTRVSAAIKSMQPHGVDLDELSQGRVVALCIARPVAFKSR